MMFFVEGISRGMWFGPVKSSGQHSRLQVRVHPDGPDGSLRPGGHRPRDRAGRVVPNAAVGRCHVLEMQARKQWM